MENDQSPKLVTRAHLFARIELTPVPAEQLPPADEPAPTPPDQNSDEEK